MLKNKILKIKNFLDQKLLFKFSKTVSKKPPEHQMLEYHTRKLTKHEQSTKFM